MEGDGFEAVLDRMREAMGAEDLLQRILDAHVFAWSAETWLFSLVREARADGYPWTSIGSRLGISAEQARRRFGDPVGEPPFFRDGSD